MNKISLWLYCRTVRVDFFPVPRISFSRFMGNVQYLAGQGSRALATLAAHDAQAAGGQVAQVWFNKLSDRSLYRLLNTWLRKFNQPRHKYLNKLRDKPNTEKLR